jgi:hypothetical protein
MARPKIAEPRELVIHVRLTQREYHWLLALSLTERRDLSALARARLLAGMPPPALALGPKERDDG